MRPSNTSASRYRASLWQGEEGTINPEQGGQTSPRTDSQRPGPSPPPLARRKAVPNTSRLLLGRRLEKHTLPTPKPSLLRRPLSCPRGTHVPQALPLALSASRPALAGCPGWGCLQTDPHPLLCAVSPGPMGQDAGALGGGCSSAPISPRLFQSAGPSLGDTSLSPTTKGIAWGAPSAGEKWRGEWGEGGSHLASRPIAQWWVSASRSVSQPRLRSTSSTTSS